MPGADGAWLVAQFPAPLCERGSSGTPPKALRGMARTSREGGVKERNEGITGRFSLGNRGATGPVRGTVAVIERAV